MGRLIRDLPLAAELEPDDDVLISRLSAPQAMRIKARALLDRGQILAIDGKYGDDSTDVAGRVMEAEAGAVAAGKRGLLFPPGVYAVADPIAALASRVEWYGFGATLKFYHDGEITIGSDLIRASYRKFIGLSILVHSSSTADAPIVLHRAGRVYFQGGVEWQQYHKHGIKVRDGWVQVQDGFSHQGPTADSFIEVDVNAGITCAAHVQAGVYSGFKGSGKPMMRMRGAGTMDGATIQSAFVSDFPKAMELIPSAGGKVSNVIAYANLLDQVDQECLDVKPAPGAAIGDIDYSDNTINGWAQADPASEGGLISIDLTGATHDAVVLRIEGNQFKDANDCCIELKGGAFNDVVANGNVASDYGRRGLSGSRFARFRGTYGHLEFCHNRGRSGRERDFDVELHEAVIASRKIEGNTFGGATRATVSEFSTYRHHTGVALTAGFTGADPVSGVSTSIRGLQVGRSAEGVYDLVAPSPLPRGRCTPSVEANGRRWTSEWVTDSQLRLRFFSAAGAAQDPGAVTVSLLAAAG